jgi:sialic acid synthase SpsE
MMTRPFSLGGFPVGSDHPPIFFAEIGSFFNGNPEPARELIRRIIDCRDAVPEQPVVLKTEILDDPEICLPGDTVETYASKGGGVKKENYRELIERKVMKTEHYIPLFKMCRDAKIPFVVSVYDMKAAKSSNLTHVPLIRYTAGLGLPMVIDTGRASIAEVHRAVDTARKGGCFDIVVQHSPEGHPAPAKSHNLRIMRTYMQTFGLPAGLSDHYTGDEMLYLSVALGASVLEKGIYFDPDELDQDIAHSMGIDDLPRVLRMVHDSFIALGRAERDPQLKIDWVIGTSQRQCLVANRDLRAGDPITLETVRFAFPMKGIPVEHWDLVSAWHVSAPVKAGQPIRWEHVAPASV